MRRGRSTRRAVDREIRHHLEERIDTLVRQGMSREKACREAERRFGDIESIRGACEDITRGMSRQTRWAEVTASLVQDARSALRNIGKNPAFAAGVIATLALGIWANTAIFAVVNAVLLRPLPYDRPEELVMLWELDRTGKSGRENAVWPVAPANYTAWVERTNAFTNLAAFNYWRPTLSEDGRAERIWGSVVTPNLFELLGVAPVVGSGFRPEHSVVGNHLVVLLSHGLWQRRFGGDLDVVGRTIRLGSQSFEVLGVLPEEYRHPSTQILAATEVWAPIAWTNTSGDFGRHLRTVARMKSGVTLGMAEQNVAAVARRLETEFPDDMAGWGVVARPIRDQLFSGVHRALFILLGGAGFVLLIMCANVANLVLARSHGRRREFAIRTSLGAGRIRLARQLVAESAVLTAAGGVVGLSAVQIGMGLLRAVQSRYISSVADIRVDGTVVAFVVAFALAAGILFGLLPVLQMSRSDLRAALTEESAGSGTSGRARRLRSGLVVAEVILATVLAVGAGLMARSFATLIAVPTGFDGSRVLTFDVTLPTAGYESAEQIRTYHAQLMPRLRGLPGVEVAALVSDLPFTTENRFLYVSVADDPNQADDWTLIEYRMVGPGYFRAMDIDLIAGRAFRDDDRGDGDMVPVIVNQQMAAHLWPNQGALGKRFLVGDFRSPVMVVGVVGDILDDGFDGEREPRFYEPFAYRTQRSIGVVLRSIVEPSSLIDAIGREAAVLGSGVAVSGFRTVGDLVSESVADERMALTLAGGFASLALALAAVGIYGVMSYAVGERRREIGVRSALGARPHDVMKLVLGQSGTLTLVGVLGGLLLAIALARLMSAFLYGVRPTDLVTLGGAAVALATVAFVASYLPASRATKIPPAEALRTQR